MANYENSGFSPTAFLPSTIIGGRAGDGGFFWTEQTVRLLKQKELVEIFVMNIQPYLRAVQRTDHDNRNFDLKITGFISVESQARS